MLDLKMVVGLYNSWHTILRRGRLNFLFFQTPFSGKF